MADIAELGIAIRSDGVVVAANRLKDLEAQAARSETASGRLEATWGKLATAAKALAAAWAMVKLANFVKDAAMAAARYETLGVVLTVVGKNAGYTAGQMNAFASAVAAQGIALTESRSIVARMAQAQLDLTKSSELARVAQDAAVIGGINSTEAFERMVYAIQSGQPEMLRTIGLNVSFERSYQQQALALHKSVAALNETEKAQARMNAVLEYAPRIAGAYEAAMGTAGKQITSFTRYLEDFKVVFGEAFNPATTSIVKDLTQSMKDLTEAVKDPAFVKAMEGLSGFAATLVSWTSTALTESMKVFGNTAARIGGVVIMMQAFIDRNQSEMDIGTSIVGSSNPAIALERAFREQKDRANMERTRRGQVIAPGTLEKETADFNKFREEERLKAAREAETLRLKQEQARLSARASRMGVEGEVGVDRLRLAGATDLEIKLAEMDAKFAQSVESHRAKLADLDTPDSVKGEMRRQMAAEAVKLELDKKVAIMEVTREAAKASRAQQAEVDALRTAAPLFGEAYQDRIAMSRAATAAQETYIEAVKKGVPVAQAAADQANALLKAQMDIDARKDNAAKGLAAGFGGSAYDAERDELSAKYGRAAQYTKDVAALEFQKNRKLQEMEIERLRNQGTALGGAKAAWETYYQNVTDVGKQAYDAMSASMQGMETMLTDFFMKGKMGWQEFGRVIQAEIVKMYVKQMIMAPFMNAMSGFSLAGMFGGLLGSANGNAFGASGLLAFANGGVVSSPTMFAYGGSNLGIMGERGPEAILPLSRGSNGKLGVESKGGGQPISVAVNFVNQSSTPMKQKGPAAVQWSSDFKNAVVTVVVEDMDNHGPIAQRMGA